MMEEPWEPKDVIAKIEDSLLECGICAEIPYDNGLDYHNLPCQHLICEECARQIKQRDPEQKLECPTCREVYGNDLQLNSFHFASDLNELRIEHKLEREEAMQTYQANRDELNFNIVRTMTGNYHNNFKLAIREQLGEIGSICSGEWKIYIVATGHTGFYYLDLLSRQELRKLGHQESHYSSSMVFNEGQLYVYNESQQSVELYKNEKFVIKWKLMTDDLAPCADNKKWVSLHPFPNGVLLSGSTIMQCNGQRQDFFFTYKCDAENQFPVHHVYVERTAMEKQVLVSKFLYRNKVLCLYRESLWFVDKRDRHLMEIPFQFECLCEHNVHLKEPIRHFKIPHYLAGCGQSHNIFFMTERSNKMQKLDLTRLASLSELRIRRNNVLYTHAQTPLPVSLFDGPTAGCRDMTASDNGQLTIEDKESLLHVYQPSSEQVPVTTVAMCDQAVSGPDYVTLTRYQRAREFIVKGLWSGIELFQWFRFLMIPLELLVFVLMGYHIFYMFFPMSNIYAYISDELARSCFYLKGHALSIGFKYFHLSYCVESSVLQPTTPCIFEDYGSFDYERVNVMYIDGPKCFHTGVSNGLRTMIIDYAGDKFIGFHDSNITS